MQKSQSNAARVNTPPNKLISPSETHPGLITAISLQRVNTKFSLHLCRLCLWGMSSHGSSFEFVGPQCVSFGWWGGKTEWNCLINSVVYSPELERTAGRKRKLISNYSILIILTVFKLLAFTKISLALLTFGLPPVALCCSLHCAVFACFCLSLQLSPLSLPSLFTLHYG